MDQVAKGPGPCLNVKEARASTGYLAATPTSHRLGVASSGLGQYDQASREGSCYGGQPPQGLAARSQGPASKSPGGVVPPFGALPQQVPVDSSMLSNNSPWTASSTPDWLRRFGSPDPNGTEQRPTTTNSRSPFERHLSNCIQDLKLSHILLEDRLTRAQPVEDATAEAQCVGAPTLSPVTGDATDIVPPALISFETDELIDLRSNLDLRSDPSFLDHNEELLAVVSCFC